MKAYLLAAGGLIAAGLYFGLRESGEAQARARLLASEAGRVAFMLDCQRSQPKPTRWERSEDDLLGLTSVPIYDGEKPKDCAAELQALILDSVR